jgi:hypothetical protein
VKNGNPGEKCPFKYIKAFLEIIRPGEPSLKIEKPGLPGLVKKFQQYLNNYKSVQKWYNNIAGFMQHPIFLQTIEYQ